MNGDSDVAVRLAERLLAHPHPLGGYSTVELLPGRVPDDPGIDLVIPSAGRLLGSAVERRDGELAAVQAIVDVDQRLAAATDAFERDLLSAGWTAASFGGGGGFMPSVDGPPRMYRKGEGGPMLMVHPISRSVDETELRLRIDFNFPRDVPPRHHRPEGMELMPALYAPPGTAIEGGGGGGGDAYWSSHATAKTNMPLAELEAFFAGQLVRAGWTRTSGGSADATAWSSWRLPRETDWRGLLIVLASPDNDERWLTIHMQRRAQRGGGWASAVSRAVRH